MKEIFTKEELKEMEQMQERAKAKQQLERAKQEKQKKVQKIDRFVGAIMLLCIGGMCAMIFSSILVEILK